VIDVWIWLVVLVLPWVAGTALVFALDARLTLNDGAYASACGYVLGLVLAATLYALQLRFLGLSSPHGAAAVLVGVALAAALVIQQRSRPAISIVGSHPSKKSAWWYFFLALVVFKVLLLAYEAVRQPVLSWDAWTTWLMRSRVWVESGVYVPFTDTLTALASSGYAIEAWRYPELVSWLAAWAAAWSDGWNESHAVLPWVGLAVALPLGLYGALRRAELAATPAMVAAWVLVSLPLVATHVAMTGYADLWLATSLSLGLMSAFHWLRTRHHADLLLTLLLVLAAAAMKPEGLVWASVFPLAYLASRLGSKIFLASAAAGLLLMLVLFQLEGLRLTLPVLGSVTFGWPASLTELGWHLWVYDNWHLLFWGLGAALAVALLALSRYDISPARLGLLAWVVFSLGGFLFLFLWTDSAEWARLGTANNRVMLQLVPGLVFWLAIELTQNPLLARLTRPT